MQEVIGSTPLCSTDPAKSGVFLFIKRRKAMITTIVIASYILFINIIAFVLYGVDKNRAINHEHRIPESVLLWMARLGGGLGSWLGMRHFHHKKKHSKFQILIPLWISIWMLILVLLLTILGGDAKEELELFNTRHNR